MNAKKMAKFCRPFRIVLGSALIIAAFITGIKWLYLGIIPLIAGIVGFCPACAITKQCTIFGKDLKE
ncbi:MAG: DUF2892 domain-containing protein [Epsilonproteobacteria bacterium]|nr:DUF2892 domain-containing protein [Campylobacterota bacterium]